LEKFEQVGMRLSGMIEEVKKLKLWVYLDGIKLFLVYIYVLRWQMTERSEFFFQIRERLEVIADNRDQSFFR